MNQTAPSQTGNARFLTGIALFFLVFAAFYASPVSQITDGRYSTLMSETILRRHSVDIKYAQPRAAYAFSLRGGYPYQAILAKDRLLYYMGWGGPLLALPAVAVFNAFGISTIGTDGKYSSDGEYQIQMLLAALLAAATVWIIFATGLTAGLSIPWAAVIALGAAFATQIWSTISRALWPQTWTLLLLSVVIYLLLRWEQRSGKFRPVLLATLLSWMYFARPAANIMIIVISVYVALTYPRSLPAYVISGLAWLAAFVGVSRYFFGTLLPPCYREFWWISFQHMHHRLAGLLLSPARGLFIYSPIVLFVLFLIAAYWRRLSHRRLVLAALGAIALELAVLSTMGQWWGGWSYGPRELADTVAFFALLAILGCQAFAEDRGLTVHRAAAVIASGIVLLGASIAMNAVGAFCPLSYTWNLWADLATYSYARTPLHGERLWDWSRAPFLAPLDPASLSDLVLARLKEVGITQAMTRADAQNATSGASSRALTREGQPVIEAVNGVPVLTNIGPMLDGWAPLVLFPAHRNWLVSWWDSDIGEELTVTGHGFDIKNGTALNLVCQCKQNRESDPFYFGPGDPRLQTSRIFLRIPRALMPEAPSGTAQIVVHNAGPDHAYTQASNPVWLPVGALISVKSVRDAGSLITVEGSGFSASTVVNFYTGQPALNLGGFDASGQAKIPLKLVDGSRFSFKLPPGALPGAAYVEAINPPRITFSSSAGDPGGAFLVP